MVKKDVDSKRKLVEMLISLSSDKKLQEELSANIKKIVSYRYFCVKDGFIYRFSKIMNLNQYKNMYFVELEVSE